MRHCNYLPVSIKKLKNLEEVDFEDATAAYVWPFDL